MNKKENDEIFGKKKYYQIILVVIASRSNIYDKIVKCYWNNFIDFVDKNNKNIKVIMLYSKNENPRELYINSNNIFESKFETGLIPGIFNKTLECFEYINNNYNFKHVIRTNISSFFLVDNMISLSNQQNTKNLYDGKTGYVKLEIHDEKGVIKDEIQFKSGAAFWLTKESLEYLINNSYKWKIYDKPDDVKIGLILNDWKDLELKNNISHRFDLIHNIYISTDKIIQAVSKDYYHIRIKNKIDRELDVRYMRELTNKFYPNK